MYLENGFMYSLCRKDWLPYLIYVMEGEEYLAGEEAPFRVIDNLKISYDKENRQVKGTNIDIETGWYEDGEVRIEKGKNNQLINLHGFVHYTLENKDSILSLNLEELKRLKNFESPDTGNCIIEITGRGIPDTVPVQKGVVTLPPLRDTTGTEYYNIIYKTPIEEDTFTLFLITDHEDKLHKVTSHLAYTYIDSIERSVWVYNDSIFFDNPFLEIPFLHKTKDFRNIASILATHHIFNQRHLYPHRLISETFSGYRQKNEILRESLASYLRASPNGEQDYRFNSSLARNLKNIYRASYPWREVVYLKQPLNLTKNFNYQELIANARLKTTTASANLQRVTQQLESRQKRAGGFDAATIAAGLSDFIVERAQEELNMNFLSRMEKEITVGFPEFRILFPHTLERLANFQVDQYRSFLATAQPAFITDLSNLGFSFPALFTHEATREKYAAIADDPAVYNISLVYDIANKVYEETPIDSILLHLYSRLDERLGDLDKRVANTMSGELLKTETGKKEKIQHLTEESQKIFREIDHFDFLVQLERLAYDSLVNLIEKSEHKEIKDQLNDLNDIYDNQYNNPESRKHIKGIVEKDAQLTLSSPYCNGIKTIKNNSITTAYKEIGRDKIYIPALNPTLDSIVYSYYLSIVDKEDDDDITGARLKRYEAVIPASLRRDISYDYHIRKLPYEQFDDYFSEMPGDSTLVSEGLFLLKDFLKGEQLGRRRDWLQKYSNRLEELIPLAKERRSKKSERSDYYSEDVARYFQFRKQRGEIKAILQEREEKLEAYASIFEKAENIRENLEKSYKNFLLEYDKAKQEKRSEEELGNMIEDRLEKDSIYLND
ncbi:MAG: hypothetical protein H6559_18455, partial [Lewinellaceae bacterium]|nr:hypothetical protein [Lewinellaceae bacterium]